MKKLAALALFVMASCVPIDSSPPPTRAATQVQTVGPIKSFPVASVGLPTRSNADMVQDFLDLTFQMESGKPLPVMTRFVGPITVGVSGPVSELLVKDLDGLLARLRNEAGLDIRYSAGAAPNIVVEAVPQADLQRAVPRAACFVVPRISSWTEFLRARNTSVVDWTTLNRRDRAVIFIPADAPPQEIRDCLHEELAQALGPLNDLYRLPDSVFNDDNIHAVLTGFDILVLRAYYAPELYNGMSRAAAAQKLPALFARLNPSGNLVPSTRTNETPADWKIAMETALSGNVTPARRRGAASQAVALSRTLGFNDVREGFAYYAYGRLEVNNDTEKATRAFAAADAIYSRLPETRIHSAHIAVQRAAFALSQGSASEVMRLADSGIPTAEAHQNAALLATLMMFKSEALDMLGNAEASERVRLDSLGWARYGFGSEANVSARLNEIRSLRPF